jgi:hypothetical protein
MALVHHATLTPSKLELVEAWLPSRPWAIGRTIVSKVAEYRFDDPAGEVGVETMLFTADDGTILQIPLTYRAAPLEGADAFLVGTTEHSVLGPRWVYDGCGDPVWAATLTTAILTGGSQAQMYFEENGERTDIPARMQVRGSGTPGAGVPGITAVDSVRDDGQVTAARCGDLEIVLAREVGTPLDTEATLDATWDGGAAVVAGLRSSQRS